MRRINQKLCVNIGIPFFFLGLSVSAALSQDRQQIRLAIVDVGITQKVPGPFLDLLLAAFNQHPEIALLERTEIDRLLREQALSLSLSNADMVKAGKLLAADSLLMLESGVSEGKALLRCRLVNTSYGFKLWDTSLPFPAKPEEYQIQAGILARQATQKISKITLKPENLMMLGVSNFSSEELSPKWEWLSDALATAVEQNLALYPGVVLMERTKAGSLMDERALAAGLPEALRASTVLVDGSYRIQREKGPDSISVHVRCRKQGRNLGEARIEGSIRSLGDLYPKVVAAIVSSLGKKPDTLSMQPEAEAEMLANDARSFLKIHDPEQAVPSVEAALSLKPNSDELKALLIDASLELHGQFSQSNIFKNDKEGSKEGLDLFIATALKIYPLIEEVMLADSVQRSQSRFLPEAIERYFFMISNWFSGASRKYSNISIRQKEALQEIDQLYWHLYKLGMGAYPEGSNRRQRMMYLAAWAFELCNTVDEAIQLSRDLLLNNNNVINSLGALIRCLRNPRYAEWPKQKGATEKIARYLEELTQSDNSRIRLLGEWASMTFYKEAIPENRKHLERFLELYKKEDLLVHDDIHISIPIEISISADAREDRALQAKYCLDILEYAFQKQLINKNSLLDSNLAHSAVGAINYYIDTNRIPEASALLQRATAEFKNKDALNTLTIVKKRLMDPLMGRKPKSYSSVLLYSSKGLSPEVHFRRLIVNDKAQAVVYSDTTNLMQLAQYGIMQLSPENLAPISSQWLPFKTKYDLDRSDGNKYRNEGPEAAADDQAIYLGIKQYGIAVLYKNGSSKLLNEDTGLATNVVRSLEILDGKLYATVGSFGMSQKDNGMMEVDLKTGISTVLFSNKSKEKKGELDGTLIAGIAADPERHALWILCLEEYGPLRLYRYYPQDNKLERVDNDSIKMALLQVAGYPPHSIPLHKRNDSLMVEGSFGTVVIDTRTDAATLLLSFSSVPRVPAAKWLMQVTSDLEHMPKQAIPMNRDLISKTEWELLYFHDGEREPDHFEESLTAPQPTPDDIALKQMAESRGWTLANPKGFKLRDIALTKKGLLVLTDDSLYLIPEIVERNLDQPLSTSTPQ
jgi:hypothetical protein